jgi:methionyl aminopeptidase
MDDEDYINSPDEIQLIRKSCELTRDMLDLAGSMVQAGVTTDEIDVAVHDAAVAAGAYPSTLNYSGFPKSLCTSINEVVCHGIPDNRLLCEGDIMNVDISTFLDGYHGDSSRMFTVATVSDEAERLIEATRRALEAGIAECRPGAPLNAIGAVIESVAEEEGYISLEAFCGHGVGHNFHMWPFILHHENGMEGTMKPGMIFTIEPIFVTNSQACGEWDDGWTIVTADGGLSAQWEHTILITDERPEGHEVLTAHSQ